MDSHITIELQYRERLSGEQVLIACSPESFIDVAKFGVQRCLRAFGFEIPFYISYCLASNDMYHLKYRKFGATYHIFISNSF